jgi:hypothetical protein
LGDFCIVLFAILRDRAVGSALSQSTACVLLHMAYRAASIKNHAARSRSKSDFLSMGIAYAMPIAPMIDFLFCRRPLPFAAAGADN